jgi:hypothetical protein
MTYYFRPSHSNVTDAARATVTQPGGAAAVQWWLGPWPGFPAATAINPANCVAAYRAVNTPGSVWGAGPTSLAESYVNLNAPGVNDAAPGVAPAWAGATGWTFAGAQYLTTGIVLPTGGTLIAQISASATPHAVLKSVVGSRNGALSTRLMLANDAAGVDAIQYQYGNFSSSAPAMSAGNLAGCGGNFYRNGVFDFAIAGYSNVGAFPVYIGARNTGGAASLFFSGNILSIAVYGVTLDANQAAALGTAITGAMAQL